MTRRTFATTLAASSFSLQNAVSQAAPKPARIKIDTERVIGPIDPMIYGNFAEHLGRCIEGGIFAEGSPLSTKEGFRRDVLEAAKGLHVTQLRWPGGNFASNYHWMDGIGPRDQRPARLEMAWGTIESNRFGTHEFLDYCDRLGTTPYICANLGTGTWEEAQRWVEYCNVAEGTAMAKLRQQNGRRDPWIVKYWGLGNEMDGSWQMGHRSPEDYGKFALETAKLMKWTDPNVQLVAAGSSDFGPRADWTGWNRIVLDYLKHHAEYLSLHTYVGNQDNDYEDFVASSLSLGERTKTAEGVIRAALSGEPASRRIYIAWDEYNVWYRARGSKERGRRILEERYNLEDALVIATFLNTFINNAHIVKMANMAQLVNVIAPIFTDEQRMFLQTIYYPLQLFAGNSRGNALDVFVNSPVYKTKRRDGVPYLDASAAYVEGTLVVNAVNRSRTEPLDVTLQAQDKQFSGTFEVAEVNGPDIKSQNDFGVTNVRTTRRTVSASGATLRVQLPPHSYTMLKGKLA